MGFFRTIKKVKASISVRFNPSKGFLYYKRWNRKVFIRHQKDFLLERDLTWLCEELYYKYYLPKNGDTVVDFGAGYGEEALYLYTKSPGVRYIGIEIQPVIYECLSNTYNELGDAFQAVPYAINSSPEKVFISSQSEYISLSMSGKGYIEVPSLSWREFLKHYDIGKVDLMKMNIEGAEVAVLEEIQDFTKIDRVLISCHDFRANNGEDEYFRTKDRVKEILIKNDFKLSYFETGVDHADDYLFGYK